MSSAEREERERLLDELSVLDALGGDRDAFEALVERWQERLWRHALRLTGRDDAAWDVMQEAWMAVARSLRKLRDPGAFRRWAFTIVTRAATDRLRRRGPEPTAGDDALDELPAPEPEGGEREQAVAMLRAALDRLPTDQRALLALRYLEGFELWELARILEVPEGTVKSRLFHARQNVKTILERMQP